VLIAISATVSLVLIGLLVFAITPDRNPAPIAANSTVSATATAAEPSVVTAVSSTSAISATSAAITPTALPVVTPVGKEGWAVTTRDALDGETGWTKARLPSGSVVDIEVIGSDPAGGLVVVTLPVSAAASGYELAAKRPAPSDTVVVNAEQPRVVPLDDLAYIDVEEATPVLDAAGALVGLCTDSQEGTTLMTVDTMPGSDPTDEPSTSAPTVVETTQPETTAVETTAVESTSPESTDASVPESSTPSTEAPESTEPAFTYVVNEMGW
jgi:hypothetical protein